MADGVDGLTFLERCAGIEGATLGAGVFSSGPAIWVGKREIAHLEEDGVLDLRLTKAAIRSRRAELEADQRVSLRPGSSDWLEIKLLTAADAEDAFALVVEAVAANIGTAKPGPPPTGAELERRRRFH